ncbi:hypothetical protein V1525DRAFT_402880 [Lipomyces kononenkoae]|uniref:Uncharacterized protein n=1 Tax=Lipomyces kononenkoae TaxID=34357 RepID=A0ACC3T2K3_LIPKO
MYDVDVSETRGRGVFRIRDTASSSIRGKSPRFAFVLEKNQPGIRSHAMRESWKQRQKKKRERPFQQAPRRLLPRTVPATSGSSHNKQLTISAPLIETRYTNNLQERELDPIYVTELRLAPDIATEIWTNEDKAARVPSQVLTGINHTLAGVRVDPFDMCPVKLTSQHQKLLHHWLGAHATMMFEELPIKSFSPMRDVWFPLDLSNASSFNTVMAHSAAHLASLQGAMDSLDALTYKAEALRILNIWLHDPIKSLSDEAFAAVVRLLTFERYWGCEQEWRIHRDGLQRMIEARGGLVALQDNWRVGLVVCWVVLVSKPSWFDSSHRICEIWGHPLNNSVHPILASIIDLHKIHCLWLISFIQDMRTLTRSSSQLHHRGLGRYHAVHDAALLLRFYFQRDAQAYMHEVGCGAPEYDRLACLFLISVLLQESIYSPDTFTEALATSACFSMPSDNSLAVLDASLHKLRNVWEGSVENLHLLLFDHFIDNPDGSLKAIYAMQMTDVLKHLSLEARRGVEMCLINMLCGTKGGKLKFSS